MFLDSVFNNAIPTPNGAVPAAASTTPSSGEAPRVDLPRVLTGLRHLAGSAEPGRVFAELAAVCVPALCDDMVIDIQEAGDRRYRVRRPGTPALRAPDDLPQQAAPGVATVHGQSVTVHVTSLPGGGPGFTARLVCTWHPGYAPTDTDAALVGVLADHATAVVHRERTTTGQLPDTSTAHQVGAALGRVQRVAAATGILMALQHLTATQARQLLARASDRTHRSLLDVADSVLHTGALPDHHTTRTTSGAQDP